MPSWSWSDPSAGQQNTMGEIASRGNPIGPRADFSDLVRAILANKKQESDQMNQALSGLTKGVGDYMQGQQNGQLADYQQTMSQSQPGGIVDDPSDPNYNADLWQSDLNNEGQGMISGMAPKTAMQAIQWNQQRQDRSDKSDMEQRLLDQRIATMQSLQNQRQSKADQYNQTGPDDGTNTPSARDIRSQQLIDNDKAKAERQAIADSLGVTPAELGKKLSALKDYKVGETDFPLLEGNGTPGDVKQKIIDYYMRGRQTSQPQPKGSPAPTGTPGPMSLYQGSQRVQSATPTQADVDQAIQAQSGPSSGPQVGQHGNVNGIPAVWDGHGWVKL